MSKLIPLTRGLSTIVDDEDYDYLIQWKWYAATNNSSELFYAARNIYWGLNGNQKSRKVLMHRELIGVSGLEVDHINGDSIDNRRENLRLVTRSQNQMNSRGRGGASKYKGVNWHKGDAAWEAKIRTGGKQMYLGEFLNEETAALAYDAKAIELFGEFALTNQELFPNDFRQLALKVVGEKEKGK